MDSVTRRYSFKLYPTAAQDARLHDIRRLCAQFYNAMLEQRIRQWWRPRWLRDEAGGWHCKRHLTYYDQCSDITALRAAEPEYAAIPSDVMAVIGQRLDRAWKAGRRRQPALAAAFRCQGEGPVPAGIKMGDWQWSCGVVRKCRERGWSRMRKDGNPRWMPRFQHADAFGGFGFRRHRSGWRFDMNNGGRNGKLYIKGVQGLVKLRGKFPAAPEAITCADVMWRENKWWLSVVVEMKPRMEARESRHGTLHLDMIDSFAEAAFDNGTPIPQPALVMPADVETVQREMAMKVRGSGRYRRLRARKAKAEARAARQRREALHEWSTALARVAERLCIVAPESVVEAVKSGRGGEVEWGANVATKAAVNRHVLAQAPAEAISQLKYKLAERGGEAAVVAEAEASVSAGNQAVRAAKKVRRAARTVKRKAA